MGNKIVLRCPIIPTLNDRDDHFKGISDVANSLKNILEINIEPYHPLGSGKADRSAQSRQGRQARLQQGRQARRWGNAPRSKDG